MAVTADLTHPALTLIAKGTLEQIGARIRGYPWDSTLLITQVAQDPTQTPALVVLIDHRELDADALITKVRHDGRTYCDGLPMGDAHSIDTARRTHFEGSGHPPPDFVAAYLHYLRRDAYIQPDL